ncbi:MAG: hypothetical protein A3I44_03770 [Candidatus Sungbacteria bacterium RIFCSPLOWO2_02_FULL_51_17]|uniref:Uncharacterized protein n=1 Tax=Candidatus Sungbacteria bacterium RIFCSPHIGHO2_02_FULL_51_29 TaxID=1802273 RepID=A0A1G2KQ00_9BACT|nr:MAG: hypothetical protein A2676_02290 [Candidatus Sungbacteria bacterium RIFCSPHIGHO2_01_FULL_51_22]OHA01490.1 MAG: hypothetical protein A3C16_05595 [Candidatus Sungbacteria bacterium RIFCSPHIGHO2_02_FULL_51_29]OHA06986.1 MAG: hypothetical protein A3B29_00300 [Candidatus Sungbacteria bacterium RIFCSPLOWO2_01_FULL_51_34]OHA11205.1 MAG: hypothetical protein A3I44_03770 [Candidatus Sungbacteria bacterium RIFCSPLOWO2_02_FULL_51_17]
MNTEKAFSLCLRAGECLQTIKFLAETGRAAEAKKLIPELADLRGAAREAGISIDFFERRTYVRNPHPEFPGHKPRATLGSSIGAWGEGHGYHFCVTVELIIDGTIPGGPQVIPGDIFVDSTKLHCGEDVMSWQSMIGADGVSRSASGWIFGIKNNEGDT